MSIDLLRRGLLVGGVVNNALLFLFGMVCMMYACGNVTMVPGYAEHFPRGFVWFCWARCPVRELELRSSSMYHGSYRIGNALSAFSNTSSLDLAFVPSGSSK
jgi:hypothetical protein